MNLPPPESIPGDLVTIPLGGKHRPLDGFLARAGKRSAKSLVVFVHGMGSNFYRSGFKKAMLRGVKPGGPDVLTFNNRGAETATAHETFRDCLRDLDATLDAARAWGYRTFILVGHSTGCQKITYYQALRKRADVAGLVLAAIGDDLAIARRNLGKRYRTELAKAKRLVASGNPDTLVTGLDFPFAAHRFLSIADPAQVEARLFDMNGKLDHFRKIKTPILIVLPEKEEYACIPVEDMIERLAAKTNATRFESVIIGGANHGFHGDEEITATTILNWARSL